MRGTRAYKRLGVLGGPELCVVEEERRDGSLANYIDYDTGDLGPLDSNNATSDGTQTNELLVAFALKVI